MVIKGKAVLNITRFPRLRAILNLGEFSWVSLCALQYKWLVVFINYVPVNLSNVIKIRNFHSKALN